MNRKALLIVVACTVAAFLSACSKSTPPSIAIGTAPPATLEVNNSAPVAATVTHDSHNEGVDWTCSPSPCGTFNPTHTASGASTTFTASDTAGSVTITADATAKPTVTATASVTVNAVATASNLTGNYVFNVSGWDAAGDFYAATGAVALDGNGNVTAGEEDLNNTVFTAPVLGDALTGTYTVGSDGQGTMILNATVGGAADPNVGVAGVQTMSFVVVNSNHILINEFDSADTSSGTMDFQTAAAVTSGMTGNYALTLGGFLGREPYSLGGVATATGTGGTLTGTGTGDQDLAGSTLVGGTIGGSISATVDAMGRGSFTIGGLTFTSYIVGTEAVYFVEVDVGAVTSGQAYGQGAGTFSAASLTAGYVMDEPQPFGEGVNGAVALAGQFTADGGGTLPTSISGVTDYNDGGIIPVGPGPDTLLASYLVSASGYGSMAAVDSGDVDFAVYGVYLVDPALNINDPNNTSGGGGALIAEIDPDALGIGFLAPQSATALTSVNNGNQFNGFDQVAGDQWNSTGQLAFTPTSFAGTADVNDLNTFVPSQTETTAAAVSGVITADTTNAGRYTVAVTVGSATENHVSYVASGTLSVDVDVDSNATNVIIGSGITEGQQ